MIPVLRASIAYFACEIEKMFIHICFAVFILFIYLFLLKIFFQVFFLLFLISIIESNCLEGYSGISASVSFGFLFGFMIPTCLLPLVDEILLPR